MELAPYAASEDVCWVEAGDVAPVEYEGFLNMGLETQGIPWVEIEDFSLP